VTPREFWSSADPLARSALVIAAIAVLVHVATFAGLSLNGIGLITVVIHIAVAIVFAAVGLRTSRWMNAVARRRVPSPDRRQVPRWLTVLAVSAVVYAVAPFGPASRRGLPSVRWQLWERWQCCVRRSAPAGNGDARPLTGHGTGHPSGKAVS